MLSILVLVVPVKVILEVEEGARKLVNDPARTALQAPMAGEAASAAAEVLHQRMGAGNMYAPVATLVVVQSVKPCDLQNSPGRNE